jgi:hypothetical protein
VEKLVYVLFRRPDDPPRRPDDPPAGFAARVRERAAPALHAAGARQVALNLADEAVLEKQSARVGAWDPPVEGMVSFWLDCADDRAPAEEALASAAGVLAGYLVVESVPLRNTTHVAPPGERTPGINMVTCIERPARMTPDAWIAHWHGHHKRVALETQCTYAYVRNVVVRPLTPDAPPWSGIVEEGFPAEAVGNPMVWYDAGGDPEVLKRNLGRMVESCQAFLDLDRVVSTPMSEYRLEDPADD